MDLWQSVRGTTAAVAIYLFIFIAVLKTDELPALPKPNNRRGLNLLTAWQDLHTIATRPHPFNSHANDLLHAYLLGRLEPIAAAYPHVHVVDDRVSNASYEQTYFEGTNILVKVDGTAEDLHGAVLFSAHFDSVSTASGATDDGMAIASMLQMVEKLAKTRSKRTAIFNFNNGEEDGLNGAHVTDYSIYAERGGMQGLDLAFYKGRSYYHTKYDAVPFLQGGTRALWSMMEALDAAGRALLDQDNSDPSGDVVYFDFIICKCSDKSW
ncbi:hypothetical protein C0995_014157 [Termitomyces sp. Mi166|nr:hypothetical protein C0995_014157 [Termitomyces sp. Mi166\